MPDLAAYTSTEPRDLMGIDAQNIALGGWRLRETYYSYQTTKYNTTWGVYDQPTTSGFPDLTFNVVLERRFISAAITYLSPLAVVFFLLFGLVMLSTSDPDRRSRFGYSASTVLTNATALLFVVLLAHV